MENIKCLIKKQGFLILIFIVVVIAGMIYKKKLDAEERKITEERKTTEGRKTKEERKTNEGNC